VRRRNSDFEDIVINSNAVSRERFWGFAGGVGSSSTLEEILARRKKDGDIKDRSNCSRKTHLWIENSPTSYRACRWAG
jgi:hypothetical protein